MEKGYVQVYTGNGKGKTTASLGLALRALAAGKRVFIGQFVKGMQCSELSILEKMDNLDIKQYGQACFIKGKPEKKDIQMAEEGLKEIEKILQVGNYDVVILDEANIALYYSLFSFGEFWKIIENRAPHIEVIITGRNAPDELIKKADLVTEMREIKHYYQKGVGARVGIEK